ncbi:MAG: flagellar motor protein MotB [Cypionkella sp.]|nr:flagellar motor protein MotB [Cypionkella sp.]
MAGQGNAAPIIIKRKKVIQGGGHHGGAWKVAYADFVTAMMAFFMLMWLLNATTEKQRKGIADYFNPTIPITRVSGGGDGAFGGDSIYSEQSLAKNGTGQPDGEPSEDAEQGGKEDAAEEAAAAQQQAFAQMSEQLSKRGGESMTMERLMRHVITRVTDEGLVVELFDLPDAPLFDGQTDQPTENTRLIAALLTDVFAISTNNLALNGHIQTYPVTLIENPAWDLTTRRAHMMRQLLEGANMPPARIVRVTGHADRKPVTNDPAAIRNNRIEVVLLRKDR